MKLAGDIGGTLARSNKSREDQPAHHDAVEDLQAIEAGLAGYGERSRANITDSAASRIMASGVEQDLTDNARPVLR